MNQELSFGSIVGEHRLGLPERTLVVKYQSRLETALLSGPLDLPQTAVPTMLPQTGGVNPPSSWVWLLLTGSGLIVGGWFIRRLSHHRQARNSHGQG